MGQESRFRSCNGDAVQVSASANRESVLILQFDLVEEPSGGPHVPFDLHNAGLKHVRLARRPLTIVVETVHAPGAALQNHPRVRAEVRTNLGLQRTFALLIARRHGTLVVLQHVICTLAFDQGG